MEYIYGAMLLHKAGKEITEDALKAVLSSAGVSVDDGRVKATVSALKDVNVDDAIAKASVAPVAAAPAASTSSSEGGASAQAEAKPKKEEKEEASGEEAAAGLGALFG